MLGGPGGGVVAWVGLLRWRGVLVATAPNGGPSVLLHHDRVWDVDRDAWLQGVRPGQTAAEARTLCPQAFWGLLDLVAAARRLTVVWDLLATASAVVEPDPAGRPQAYAAWTGSDPPQVEVAALREECRRVLPHATLAVGLGPSRLAARLACPDQGVVVEADWAAIARRLAPCPLGLLVEESLARPGALRTLGALGAVTCGQVAALPEALLRARLGVEGAWLHATCRGHDDRPVYAHHPPRSVRERARYPQELPPRDWGLAGLALARRAAARLRPGEGVGELALIVGAQGVWRRTWPAPCLDGAVLARAARSLGERAAARGMGPVARLEVRLTELAWTPPRSRSLLDAARPRQGAVVDDLLHRLPQQALRRGVAGRDDYEAWLDLLDPLRGGS